MDAATYPDWVIDPGKPVARGPTTVESKSERRARLAFAESLYRAHSAQLVRFAMCLVGRADASQIVADAFVRSVECSSWTQVDDFKGCLYRAVMDAAAASEGQRRSFQADEASSDTTPDDTPDCIEVLSGLTELSLRQRAVTFLTYCEHLGPREVAQRLGEPIKTVGQDLVQARATLAQVVVSPSASG